MSSVGNNCLKHRFRIIRGIIIEQLSTVVLYDVDQAQYKLLMAQGSDKLERTQYLKLRRPELLVGTIHNTKSGCLITRKYKKFG